MRAVLALPALRGLSIPKWMDEQASTHGLFFTTATYRETSVLGASSAPNSIYCRACLFSLTGAEERELGGVHLDYVSENICAAFL